MSREYMVLLVDEPNGHLDVQGCKAEVFMRFTEEPPSDFLNRLAKANPGKRVYSLMGASTWYSAEEGEHDEYDAGEPEEPDNDRMDENDLVQEVLGEIEEPSC